MQNKIKVLLPPMPCTYSTFLTRLRLPRLRQNGLATDLAKTEAEQAKCERDIYMKKVLHPYKSFPFTLTNLSPSPLQLQAARKEACFNSTLLRNQAEVGNLTRLVKDVEAAYLITQHETKKELRLACFPLTLNLLVTLTFTLRLPSKLLGCKE